MCDSLHRIDLPSGGWWLLQARPRWRHLRGWTVGPDDGLVDRALVSLTAAWSFHDPVSVEALARREEADTIAVLEVFLRESLPYLDQRPPREGAEHLFACLVRGRIPPDFSEVHLMASTGWSWRALQETPVDVVRKMATYLSVRQARDTGGDVSYPELEGS